MLIIQAATEGTVDFSKAKLLDRRWWIKLNHTLDAIELRNMLRIKQLEHSQNMAVCDYNSNDKTFNHHWEEGANLIQLMYNRLFPWQATALKTKQNEYDELTEQYKKTFGDPNDPEYAAWLDKAMIETLAQAKQKASEKR